MVIHREMSLIVLIMSIGITGLLLAQETPLQRLNESPRHHEWVKVTHGNRTVQAFLVFPQVSDKVPAIVLIHENRGLSDWVRGMADQVAEAGYIAIAPDLLTGMGPNGGKTSDFPDLNSARDAIYQLSQDQITADLDAVADYIKNQSACNGELMVAGFCWGGSQSFRYATHRPDLSAAFVFYGTAPDSMEALQHINCPVYGFYGGNDARVTSTIEATEKRMNQAGKTYEPVVYDGAGHGFMRSGESAPLDDPNRKARDSAWDRWLHLLTNE